MAAVTACVLWRGTKQRAGTTAIIGMILAGLPMIACAFTTHPAAFFTCTLLSGIGTGTFASHAAPLFVTATSRELMGRVQSVLVLAQMLPLLIANPAIAVIAERGGSTVALAVWGSGAAVAGLLALTSIEFRRARLGVPPIVPA